MGDFRRHLAYRSNLAASVSNCLVNDYVYSHNGLKTEILTAIERITNFKERTACDFIDQP